MLMLVSDGQGEEMAHGPYAWQVVASLLNSGNGADRAAPRPGTTATASNCSTTASTTGLPGCQESAAACRDSTAAYRLTTSMSEKPADVADERQLKKTSSLPYLLLPRPRRVGQEEGSSTPQGVTGISPANVWSRGQHAELLGQPPSALLRTASAHHKLPPAAAELGGSSLLRAGFLPRRAVGAPPRENLVCKLSDLKDKVDWLAEEMAKLGDKRKDDGVSHRHSRLISEFK